MYFCVHFILLQKQTILSDFFVHFSYNSDICSIMNKATIL